ncbi:MAG TPA: M20/M25/M40 family metallo-hydrolase [Burkholderiaceae bacterium]|nr:M20/M25/M40 family metallo-hydrolase [Burkholderiaceae bacterium]
MLKTVRSTIIVTLVALFPFSASIAAQDASGQFKHPAVEVVMKSAQYKASMAFLEKDHDRIVEQNIALQQIPAPLRQEEQKARAFAALLKEAGLSDVTIDEEGNVLGLRKGTSNSGEIVAFVSHLDTVFDRKVDLTIKREGTKLKAPGIIDDTRGLASILGIVRAMNAANVKTTKDVLFVGSVGEEGLGDLRGVKYLLNKGQYKERIKSFIAFDGNAPDQIANTAAGSKRYEVRFNGPGGHSFKAFGTVNPMYALANVISDLSKVQAPAGTTYSVGVIGGGTSVNSIPVEAWMLVDMRSSSATDLAALEKTFLQFPERAVAAENNTRSTKNGKITVDVKLVGDRPAGNTSKDQDLVKAALAASAAHGWNPRLAESSTDQNVPMSLGIPAITIASGIGDRNHSLDEYLDVEPKASLRSLGFALTTLLATTGIAK